MKDLTNENVIHVRKDGIEFLQFRKLLEYSDVINHAYSIGLDRNFMTDNINHTLSEEQKNMARKNYKKLTNAIETDYAHIVKTCQTHTNEVKCIKKKENKYEPVFDSLNFRDTDGFITNKAKIMLATTSADCILLLFFDPVRKVIANVHSGWRGTVQRISVKAVNKMRNIYESDPRDIICCMCPSIHKCHFEVERDVMQQFKNEFSDVENFIFETKPNKKWNIDTILINRVILENAGLQGTNIIDSGICSVCDAEQIHSYRMEGKKYGLSTAVIEIKS